MAKLSAADKKAQKLLNNPQFQQNWATHMKSFGPILEDAFAEDAQARVNLCSALTHITGKNLPQALIKLNGLQKSLVTDADKTAFFFAMGLFCEYAGKFEEMAGFYSQANELGHGCYLPYLKAAKFNMDSFTYDVAEKYYRAAIRCLNPADNQEKLLLGNAHMNLASCLLMMHRPEEAAQALTASRNFAPMAPGRAAPEALLHAIRGEKAELLASLTTLKEMAPFAYDSIKKSTDKILAGTEPQFFPLPVSEERIAAFWNWFEAAEADLKSRLDKQDYTNVMTAVGDHLLEAFPFLEQRPYTAIGKSEQGYVIQLKDRHATAIIDAYQRLTAACPEDLKGRWFFHVIH